ncbi:MAG: hypothetical protein K0S86_3148, partial [Geminicoccaceae bacterium]|nr:hypothetical protein [Geminicoccaceae bacterium]
EPRSKHGTQRAAAEDEPVALELLVEHPLGVGRQLLVRQQVMVFADRVQ